MTKPFPNMCFKTTLLRPARPTRATWAFVILPADASGMLSTRNMVSIEGRLNGHPFKGTLSPDGHACHWLKIPKVLRKAACIQVGDMVTLEITQAAVEPATRVPADLRIALAAHRDAKAQWVSLTPVARRDWIQWLVSAKQAETRAKRIRDTCDMLESGKRRVCCFDRSGIYSKSIKAPTPA